MKRLIALMVALLFCAPSMAADKRVLMQSRGVVVDAQTLDANRLTSSIYTEGYSTLTMFGALTRSSATALRIDYCEGTGDTEGPSPTWYRTKAIPAVATTGIADYADYQASITVDGTDLAADHNPAITLNVTGHKNYRCLWGADGADPNDTLTVRATVSVP